MRSIENIFGLKIIELGYWEQENSLPLFLQNQYSLYHGTIESHHCIFLHMKLLTYDKYTYNPALTFIENEKADSTVMPTTPTLIKHMARIEKIANMPVIVMLDFITTARIKSLIARQVPFIVGEKIIYLPFLGTYIKNDMTQRLQVTEKLTPAAQLIFFYCLYNMNRSIPLTSIAAAMPFSLMTISRAAKQLVTAGIFKTHKEGVQVILDSDNTNLKNIYERALPFLKSPVAYTGYMDQKDITKDFLLASLSALAARSMINPDTCKTYAIKKELFKNKLQDELIDPDKQIRIELWNYDPKILAVDNMVDSLSLAASLQHDTDERVKSSINKILSFVWRR